MRNIDLRAWDVKRKTMHYDFQFIGTDWIVFTSDKQPLDDIPHPFNHTYPRNQLKIMQSTGLKDKNGLKIFEGDWIESDSHNPKRFLVEFIEGGFCTTYPDCIPTDINHFYSSTGCCIKVIGNIYEGIT